MGQPTTLEATQTIGRHQWTTFLAKFTRENRGAHAELEILGGEIGRVVPLQDRPFDGIAADTKDGEDTVWITFGSIRKIGSPTDFRRRPLSECGPRPAK